jgi:uncharacterized membrane protein
MDPYSSVQFLVMSILVTALALVLLIGGLVSIVFLTRRMAQPSHTDRPLMEPLEIARQRYARGEISKEEFDQLRHDLDG